MWNMIFNFRQKYILYDIFLASNFISNHFQALSYKNMQANSYIQLKKWLIFFLNLLPYKILIQSTFKSLNFNLFN